MLREQSLMMEGLQSVLTETYNNHLSIAAAGTKSAAKETSIVNGNLTTAATATCVLDLSSHGT